MQLISAVQVRGFRSIQDQRLDHLGVVNAVVGKNSSGKSNLLRALNLFFNGETEPGVPLVFERDHHEQVPRLRQKKRIRIAVTFELPKTFKLRKELVALREFGPSFTITRSWELDARRNVIEHFHIASTPDRLARETKSGTDIVRQFLALILYRYIPNRTVPAHLLRHESRALANSIFMRMKRDQHSAALFEELTAAAARWLRPATEEMEASGSPLSSPTVATGESLAEMLTMSGFYAVGPHGARVQDEEWGAGHQSFFLFQVLRAIDTDYGRFFGWRQATIWGIEEPESALHRDLETQLAGGFRQWTADPQARLQVLLTTHSPVFAMAADRGFWCEVNDRETLIVGRPIAQLARDSETRGVTGWMHPILSFPWNPIVLVEGEIDVRVLQHVADQVGLGNLRFLSLPHLDPRQGSPGKDDLAKYLARHCDLIRNRQKDAPLIVLVDWEVSTQDFRRIQVKYGEQGERYVMKMEVRHADLRLGSSFKGIERFYPARLFEEAHAAGELTIGFPASPGGPWSVDPEQLKRAKGKLLGRFLALRNLKDQIGIVRVLGDIEEALRRDSPFQLRLPGIERSEDGSD